MSTTINIPDELLDSAARVGQQMGVSRDEVIARALRLFLFRFDPEAVTEALNLVYSKESSMIDPVIARMRDRSLPKDEW